MASSEKHIDPTGRFSSRVDDYARYRPHYPRAIIDSLAADCGMTAVSVIADVGSGTGILSERFLENGNEVYGVEPNNEMRGWAERFFAGNPRFHSIAGRAESTGLEAHSVDFVTAGQAFHWFDAEPARQEFLRILRADGATMLVWNERDSDASPFLAAYEELVQRFAIDYAEVGHRRVSRDVIAAFYRNDAWRTYSFPNGQSFDLSGIQGRLLSSSYTPQEGDARYRPMLNALEKLFSTYETGGTVEITYRTTMYVGALR